MINSNVYITVKEIKPNPLKFQIITSTFSVFLSVIFHIFAINAHTSFYIFL